MAGGAVVAGGGAVVAGGSVVAGAVVGVSVVVPSEVVAGGATTGAVVEPLDVGGETEPVPLSGFESFEPATSAAPTPAARRASAARAISTTVRRRLAAAGGGAGGGGGGRTTVTSSPAAVAAAPRVSRSAASARSSSSGAAPPVNPVTLALPSSSSRIVAGPSDPCVTPSACAYASADETSAATRSTSASVSDPAARRCSSEPPGRYSKTAIRLAVLHALVEQRHDPRMREPGDGHVAGGQLHEHVALELGVGGAPGRAAELLEQLVPSGDPARPHAGAVPQQDGR